MANQNADLGRMSKEVNSQKQGKGAMSFVEKKGPASGGSKAGNPTKGGKINGNNGR